jgi:hypothetical protein
MQNSVTIGCRPVSNLSGVEEGREAGSNRRPDAPEPLRGRVVRLKERSLFMLKNDLILRNPLRLMQDEETQDSLPPGGFGAVLARAGVGKTALLVQLALNAMLRNQKVLHISLEDPVNKVSLWYDEVFSHIADQYAVSQAADLWASLLPHRFIMTFRVERFSVPKLEERLTDLTAQNIFHPNILIVDGFPFDESVREPLQDLKALAGSRGFRAWFTVRTHRHEQTETPQMAVRIEPVADLFDVVIHLQPVGKEIHIKTLKGRDASSEKTGLVLDPSTLLVTDLKAE